MKRVLLVMLLALPVAAQQSRIASDFEIAQMEKQLANAKDFVSQLSGRLNLGDVRAARNEPSLARAEYLKAYDLAQNERLAARRASSMTQYATATAYAALAQAKLGNETRAFAMLEEATRYTSDSAKTWNLYASAMNVLRYPRKAVSAARNAVAIASADVQHDASVPNLLDLGVYQYALASSLIEADQRGEAERILAELTTTLRSRAFDELRREVARRESFEIYSTARGDAAAYLSLANRSQLRLGSLYEQRGDTARAKAEYQRVLELRSDDATALTALARLAGTSEDRERYFADAFDANPFSMSLVREYQRWLRSAKPGDIDESTTGGRVRRALVQLARGENRAARESLDALLAKFPANATLQTLRAESEAAPASLPDLAHVDAAGLRQILALFAADTLTPAERVQIDQAQITSVALFDAYDGTPAPGQTIFASGTIEGVPFRFSEPTAFQGMFTAGAPLHLMYRILGATRDGDVDVLLVEPLGVRP